VHPHAVRLLCGKRRTDPFSPRSCPFWQQTLLAVIYNMSRRFLLIVLRKESLVSAHLPGQWLQASWLSSTPMKRFAASPNHQSTWLRLLRTQMRLRTYHPFYLQTTVATIVFAFTAFIFMAPCSVSVFVFCDACTTRFMLRVYIIGQALDLVHAVFRCPRKCLYEPLGSTLLYLVCIIAPWLSSPNLSHIGSRYLASSLICTARGCTADNVRALP
jgi:hypothetical protein